MKYFLIAASLNSNRQRSVIKIGIGVCFNPFLALVTTIYTIALHIYLKKMYRIKIKYVFHWFSLFLATFVATVCISITGIANIICKYHVFEFIMHFSVFFFNI